MLALVVARWADAEIAYGHTRGPLHGIPWGAKDILGVRNYPTTWGSNAFKEQVTDYDFLGSFTTQKRDWTDQHRPISWLQIYNHTLRGRLQHWLKFRLGPTLKR